MNARITILLGLGQAVRIILLLFVCVGTVSAAQTNALSVGPIKGDATYQLEFRARDKTDAGFMHALIVLWERSTSGESRIIKSAGFYPKTSTVTNVLSGPGEVLSPETLSDTDKRFRVQITDEQMRRVDWIVKNWETKNYSLGFQDCVSMVTDVALGVGLAVRDNNLENCPLPIPTSVNPEIVTPEGLIRRLSSLNEPDTPIKHSESLEIERQIRQRADRSRLESRLRAAAERSRLYPQPGHEITPTNPNDRFELQISPPNTPSFKGYIQHFVK